MQYEKEHITMFITDMFAKDINGLTLYIGC